MKNFQSRKILGQVLLGLFLLQGLVYSPLLGAQTASVRGIVASIDRYGNITTDITAPNLAGAGFEPGDMVLLEAGTFRGIVPVVLNYADVVSGNPLVRVHAGNQIIMLAVNMGNFAETFAAAEGIPVVITMSAKGAYKGELEARNLVRTAERADYASDAVFANFREVRLGGSIPANILFRSCHPAMNADSGDTADMVNRSPYAARLGEQAGIATVINLADTAEELAQRAASVPWYKNFVDKKNIIALGMGVDYKSPDFTAKLKSGLEFMISHNPPYLVHCNEGKDRAGVVVALLGALMGAAPDAIVDDYMLSYENYYGVKKGEERYSLISVIMLDILKDFNGGTAPTSGNTIAAAERYLGQAVGLNPMQIIDLKLKLAGL